ncbi:hypothetical protein KUCAC02_027063, partial [Chaenocephalus aceratus]
VADAGDSAPELLKACGQQQSWMGTDYTLKREGGQGMEDGVGGSVPPSSTSHHRFSLSLPLSDGESIFFGLSPGSLQAYDDTLRPCLLRSCANGVQRFLQDTCLTHAAYSGQHMAPRFDRGLPCSEFLWLMFFNSLHTEHCWDSAKGPFLPQSRDSSASLLLLGGLTQITVLRRNDYQALSLGHGRHATSKQSLEMRSESNYKTSLPPVTLLGDEGVVLLFT